MSKDTAMMSKEQYEAKMKGAPVSGSGGNTKLYIGSKIIRAIPMDEVTFLKTIKGQDVDQETSPGYLVLYPDGYKSWSPKRVFEEAYREVSQGEMRLI